VNPANQGDPANGQTQDNYRAGNQPATTNTEAST
jgi:hypothetical protein